MVSEKHWSRHPVDTEISRTAYNEVHRLLVLKNPRYVHTIKMLMIIDFPSVCLSVCLIPAQRYRALPHHRHYRHCCANFCQKLPTSIPKCRTLNRHSSNSCMRRSATVIPEPRLPFTNLRMTSSSPPLIPLASHDDDADDGTLNLQPWKFIAPNPANSFQLLTDKWSTAELEWCELDEDEDPDPEADLRVKLVCPWAKSFWNHFEVVLNLACWWWWSAWWPPSKDFLGETGREELPPTLFVVDVTKLLDRRWLLWLWL